MTTLTNNQKKLRELIDQYAQWVAYCENPDNFKDIGEPWQITDEEFAQQVEQLFLESVGSDTKFWKGKSKEQFDIGKAENDLRESIRKEWGGE